MWRKYRSVLSVVTASRGKKNLVDMYRTSNRRAETYADSVEALLARTTLLLLGQRRDRQRFTGQTDTRTTLYAFRRELGCSVITNDSS